MIQRPAIRFSGNRPDPSRFFDTGNLVYPEAENGRLIKFGGYAQYVVEAAGNLSRKPVSLDHMHAAALPVAALTAWDALFEVGCLVAGQKALIHAAAGGVGHIAVQLAKGRGAQVIGRASAGNAAFLRELGTEKTGPLTPRPGNGASGCRKQRN